MKRLFIRNVALFSVLALGGCDVEAKPLPEGKKDYAGSWGGQGMKLIIGADGRIDYERDGTSVRGPIQKFEGDDFTVGAFGLSTTFDVEEAPHEMDNGIWRMKVDGVDLVRVDVNMVLQEVAEQAEQSSAP